MLSLAYSACEQFIENVIVIFVKKKKNVTSVIRIFCLLDFT